MLKNLALSFLTTVGTNAPLGSWVNRLFVDSTIRRLSEYKKKSPLQALKGTVELLSYTQDGSAQRAKLIEDALDISKMASKIDLRSTFLTIDGIHFFSPPTKEIANKVNDEFSRLKDLLYKSGPKRPQKKPAPNCRWKHKIYG